MKQLYVQFDNTVIENDMEIPLDQVQIQPHIKFNKSTEKLYTIMMFDPDAPFSKQYNKQWLHWLVINTNEIVIPFSPSNPPKDSGMHRYFIFIFEQSTKININKYIIDKSKFDKNKFISIFKLKPISYIMYRTHH